jgi:hypothetical protein
LSGQRRERKVGCIVFLQAVRDLGRMDYTPPELVFEATEENKGEEGCKRWGRPLKEQNQGKKKSGKTLGPEPEKLRMWLFTKVINSVIPRIPKIKLSLSNLASDRNKLRSLTMWWTRRLAGSSLTHVILEA